MDAHSREDVGLDEGTGRTASSRMWVSASDTAALVAEVSGLLEADLPSADADVEISVRRRDDQGRFAVVLGEWGVESISYREIGFVHFGHRDGVLVIDWTYLEPEFRGRGIAADFIADVLDDLRDSGTRISVTCQVVSAFISANPQYADLVT